MIALDRGTREMLAEVRELGRTYIRPMGIEADRREVALARLATMRRELQAARLLCWQAVWLFSQGKTNALEASYAKLYAPPVAMRAVSAALDIVGEAGVLRETYLEKLYREVKLLDIGAGTQQTQRIVIARRLVGLPRE